MKVASMPPNPPSSKGPAPNLGLNKASYSAHLNRNYGKRPCHRHWDPFLEALQTALSSSTPGGLDFCPFVDGNNKFLPPPPKKRRNQDRKFTSSLSHRFLA